MVLKTVTIAGKTYPVHFGLAALSEIAETVGIESDNLLSSLKMKSLKDRITLALIGMKHGAYFAGEKFDHDFLSFSYLLDENPEALEEIASVYYLQTFGKSIEALIAEADKSKDKEVQESVAHLKNVWPVLTEKANNLASVEYTK